VSSEEPAPFVQPQPSTGFITFAGMTFGGTSAVSTALTGTGYITDKERDRTAGIVGNLMH
jgi:hypothetical protein